jgi:hypothetical protein
MKLPTLTSRFWVALGTLSVIGALFSYYLLVYVHSREEKLREDRYRALARYGENMIQTRRDYEKALIRLKSQNETIWQEERAKYFHDTTRVQRDSISVIDERKAVVSVGHSRKNGGCCCCPDGERSPTHIENGVMSGKRLLSERERNRLFLSHRRDTLRRRLSDLAHKNVPNISYEGYFSNVEFDSLQHHNFDRIYFSFPATQSDRLFAYSILTKDFVYRPQQFDEFFIIKAFDSTYQKHRSSNVMSANQTFQTFQNRIILQSVDSLLVKERGLLTSHFGEVKLADTRYKIFVHAIPFSQGESWLLCGLIEREHYHSTVRAVSPLVIVSAMLTLLFLIVAMPLLKPLIMNKFERLGFVNVWLAGFSIAYGGALLLLLIMAASHNLQSNNEVDSKLQDLAAKVKFGFESELNGIYEQLDDVKADLSRELIGPYRLVNVQNDSSKRSDASPQKPNVLFGNLFTDKIDPRLKSIWRRHGVERFPYFNYLLWIKETGLPELAITSLDVTDATPMPELAERKYFSRALNDSLWYLAQPGGKVDSSKRFSLQSIWSWTDHQPEAGFGIVYNASSFKVLAMSTRLGSVMDPALESGFGFCIIDETGEVWFHSTTSKNHQENIFTEVDHHGKLTAAVRGRVKAYFSAEYNGERKRMYVQPLTGMPLHLVAFHDEDYQRAPVVLTIFFAFAFLVAIIVVQILQLTLLYACEYKTRKLRTTGFFLKVLRPNEKCGEMYKTSISAQLTLAVICIALWSFNYFFIVVGLVTLPVMLMVFHQVLFNGGLMGKTGYFVLSLGLVVLLNIILSNLLGWNELLCAIVEQVTFAMIMVLFAIAHFWRKESDTKEFLTSAHKLQGSNQRDKPNSILIELWTKVRTWARIKLWGRIRLWMRGTGFVQNSARKLACVFPQSYYTFLSLTFFLSSIYPVIFFYRIVYWEENVLWAKFQQLEIRETSIARQRMLKINFGFLKDRKDLFHTASLAGNYLQDTCCLQNEGRIWGDKFEEELFQVWPQFGDPIGVSSAATFNKTLDGAWTWTKSGDDVGITYKEKSDSGYKDVSYRAGVPTFNPVGGPYGVWMSLLFLLSIFLIYRVIRFCATCFFGIGLIPKFNRTSPEEIRARLANVWAPCNLYITELPGSPNSYLEDEPTVIRLFGQGVDDHTYNQKKLGEIRKLTRLRDRCVAILAPLQHDAVLDFYRRSIEAEKANDGRQTSDSSSASRAIEYQNALRQWTSVLNDFEIHHLSIRPKAEMQFNSTIMDAELNACAYLQNLSDQLEPNTLEEDDFVINLEELAGPYYTSLWNSFSVDEKLVLFDLAQDRFVNMKNHRLLRILMLKGIVVKEPDGLSIMNRSFSNFIVNVFQHDETVTLAPNAEKGSWQNIQLVFVLVLIGIATFIALAQKEFFGNIDALVVAATSAFALFSRFGGFFGSDSKVK